jgi:hypothetical protein
MKPVSATKKGLLTGIVMILVSIGIFYAKGNFQNSLQYITYAVYIAGIVWTLLEHSKSPDAKHTFGDYFSQGFRCFIVVTLLMVIFTAAFLFLQPALKEQMAATYRADLLKTGNYTLPEIDDKIKTARKSFIPALVMGAVFGYLVIGAMVTVTTAIVFIQKRKLKMGV